MLDSFTVLKDIMFRTLAAVALTFPLIVCAQEEKEAAPANAGTKSQESGQPLNGVVKATIETSKGTIELELDAVKAPHTVANFIKYAEKSFYDGTIFHRVIPPSASSLPPMIQGGGFTADLQLKQPEKAIQCESKNGLKNVKGTIAMARENDPHSATSQFFINVSDNANLDFPSFDGWGYAVFGKVTKGMDVVEAIAAVPTTTKAPHLNMPKEAITITKVTVTK